MLKIKLARFGKKKQPHYRIVVNEAKTKRDGRYIDLLGHYAPAQEPKVLELDLAKYQQWIEKGAQPTETVASLAERVAKGIPFTKKKGLSKKQLKKNKQAKDKDKEEEKKEEKLVQEEKKPDKEKGMKKDSDVKASQDKNKSDKKESKK